MISLLVVGSSPATFSRGWFVRERERWVSLGHYRATQMQGVPPCRGWRDTVREAAPSSQNASVSPAIAWAAGIQRWFMAESNLILVTLLPPSFEAVLVQDACTSLPASTVLGFAEGNAGKDEIHSSPWSQEPFLCCLCPRKWNPRGRRPRDQSRSCCGLQLPPLQCCGDPRRATGKPWQRQQRGGRGCLVARSCTQPEWSPSAWALQLSLCGAGKWGHCCEATNPVPTHEGEEWEELGLTFCNTHGHK